MDPTPHRDRTRPRRRVGLRVRRPLPVIREAPDGATFVEMWNTTATPGPDRRHRTRPHRKFTDRPSGAERHQDPRQRAPAGDGLADASHRDDRLRHLAGRRVTLVLSDSETTVRAGDVVVQRGTEHRRENRSDAVTRIAFILVDGTFSDDLDATLGAAAHPAARPYAPLTPRRARRLTDHSSRYSSSRRKDLRSYQAATTLEGATRSTHRSERGMPAEHRHRSPP
jgi:hypothetical protein